MFKFVKWFISPSNKPIVCDDIDLYDKLLKLEERIQKLEEENIETSNILYETMNSISAVDARIDILTLESWKDRDV